MQTSLTITVFHELPLEPVRVTEMATLELNGYQIIDVEDTAANQFKITN